MGLKLQDVRNLIVAAQGTDEEIASMALTDLLVEIMDNHMNRHLHKYRFKATTGGMDYDDIEQTFLIACSQAITTANVNVGNPLLFILQKGKWAVVDELRKGYRSELRQYCHSCRTETRLHEVKHIITCPQCGATGEDHIERFSQGVTDDGTLMEVVVDEQVDIGDMVASDSVVGLFRNRLTGRKADVFDLIVNEGYDRDSCKNYIREVADVLGVTPANVNQRLRQIKAEWQTYMEEVAAGDAGDYMDESEQAIEGVNAQ